MLYGEVEYLKKDGSEASAIWAGRMVFDTQSLEKGEPKMKEYTVWVVSSIVGRWPACLLGGQSTQFVSDEKRDLFCPPCALADPSPGQELSAKGTSAIPSSLDI